MKKNSLRSIALVVLSLMMIIGVPATAFAADEPSAWAKEEVEKAISLNLVDEVLQSDYQADITREDFCTLIMTVAALVDKEAVDAAIAKDNPFADTDLTAAIAAFNMEIVTGKTADTFAPEDGILRQEAAAMLTRAAKALGMDVTAEASAFADADKIAAYAKESVDFVFANGVMNGTGNDNFSPSDSYTRQQAYMTALRLYEVLTAAPADTDADATTDADKTDDATTDADKADDATTDADTANDDADKTDDTDDATKTE